MIRSVPFDCARSFQERIQAQLLERGGSKRLFKWLKTWEDGVPLFFRFACHFPANFSALWGQLSREHKVELLQSPQERGKKEGEGESVLSALVKALPNINKISLRRRVELVFELVRDLVPKQKERLVNQQLLLIVKRKERKNPLVSGLIASLDPSMRGRILSQNPLLLKEIVNNDERTIIPQILAGMGQHELGVLLNLPIPGLDGISLFSHLAQRAEDSFFDQVCTWIRVDQFKVFAQQTISACAVSKRKHAVLSVLRNVESFLAEEDRVLFFSQSNREEKSPIQAILSSEDPDLLEKLLFPLPMENRVRLLNGESVEKKQLFSVALFSKKKEFLHKVFSLLDEQSILTLLRKRDFALSFPIESCSFLFSFFEEALRTSSLKRDRIAKICISAPGSLLRVLIRKQMLVEVERVLKLFPSDELFSLLREVSSDTLLNSLDEVGRNPNPGIARLLRSYGAVFSGTDEAPFTLNQEKAISVHRSNPIIGSCLAHYPLITLGKILSRIAPGSIAQQVFAQGLEHFFLDAESLTQRILAGRLPQLLVIGYAGHQVTLLAAGSLMVLCDRSHLIIPRSSLGVEIFSFSKPRALSQAITELRKAKFLAKEAALLKISRIKQSLEPSPFVLSDDMKTYLTMQNQRKNNCVNASLKIAVRVLLVWPYLTKQRPETEEGLDAAKKLYKTITQEDRKAGRDFLRTHP